jgi:6-phosphofructokinase 1
LIYLPERPPEDEQIYEDVKETVARLGRAVVVVCEGLRNAAGAPFGAHLDKAGERGGMPRDTALAIAGKIQTATGLRARAERPGLLGRSCSWALSETDLDESYRSGRFAAEIALGSGSGVLIALKRQPGPAYRSLPHAVPFSEDPGRERKMPAAFLGEPGAGGGADYMEWLRPLAGEIPPIERIL